MPNLPKGRPMSRAPKRIALTIAGLAAAILTAGVAFAQPAADRDRQPRSETEGQAPPPSNPSEQLDRSQGVIRPPGGVDPGMQVPPPDPGSQRTPVIPPPGTPGGDRTVEPK
jgi:hypothetical protein